MKTPLRAVIAAVLMIAFWASGKAAHAANFIDGYMAECSAVGTGSCTELSASGYARQPVSFSTPQYGVSTLLKSFTFNSNGVIAGRAIYDAPTGGNLLLVIPLAQPVTVGSPSDHFDAGVFPITFTAMIPYATGDAYSGSFAAGAAVGITPNGSTITAGTVISFTRGTVTSGSAGGSSLLTGSGAPTAGAGSPGQQYLDTTGHAIWLNVAGTWVQTGIFNAPTAASIPPPSGNPVVTPSAVQSLAAGTPTSTTIPVSWGAPATGTAPFTYRVEYAPSSTGSYSTFAAAQSGLTATIAGLAASTAYLVRVTASDSAGAGPASTPVTATTAAAPISTRARFAQAAATAGTSSAASLFASMTQVAGATSDRNGTMTTTADSVNYTWIAVTQAAAGTGEHFFDGTGYGGFNGAQSSSIYSGPDADPTTIDVTYTDTNGTVWNFYRSSGHSVSLTFTLS